MTPTSSQGAPDKEPSRLFTIASWYSAIIHPITLPIITFGALIYGAEPKASSPHLLFLIVILSCTVGPGLVVVALKKLGLVNDYDISERNKRTLPMILSVVIYLSGFGLLRALEAPRLVQGFMFLYAISTIIILTITLYWKISVHVTSLAGPIAALALAFGPMVYLAIVLLPPMMWARVVVKAHTLAQVIAGGLFGFFFTYFGLRIWLTLF